MLIPDPASIAMLGRAMPAALKMAATSLSFSGVMCDATQDASANSRSVADWRKG